MPIILTHQWPEREAELSQRCDGIASMCKVFRGDTNLNVLCGTPVRVIVFVMTSCIDLPLQLLGRHNIQEGYRQRCTILYLNI